MGRSQMPYVAFWGTTISRPSIPFPFFPHSLSSSLLFPFDPFLKEVNKKLSYRRQNVVSVIKHMNATVSEHMLFLSVRQYRLVGGIIFTTCPTRKWYKIELYT